jgi:hypothetical protein
MRDVVAEQVLVARIPVDIRNITPQDQRRLLLSRNCLEESGVTQSQLHGIWIRCDQGANHCLHVLDAGQEGPLAEEAMVNGHVERTPRLWVEQAVQAINRHVSSLLAS